MEQLGSLLNRTRNRDVEAFGQVVSRFQDMAFGYAYSMLGNRQDAEDAVQEAFLTAFARLETLRDVDCFPGWFRRIVLSASREMIRKQAPKTMPLQEAKQVASQQESPAQQMERTEMREAVMSAIQSLSAPNRSATTLFYIDGYTVNEVAEFLEVPSGTIKRRLHDSREQLKEKTMDVVEAYLHEQRPSPKFREEILKRISHWERFERSVEDRLQIVEEDPEWIRLVEQEIELAPLSPECTKIREQIVHMDVCHEHYVENVKAVIRMTGSMQSGLVLDCGEACTQRKQEAEGYRQALERWRDAKARAENRDACTQEVYDLIGEPEEAKLLLVDHLIGKLKDNAYRVYADADEDFALTESRIQHLDICNYNWTENLRIVLQEIAAGQRLFAWHTPDGYNAHGDCPDRLLDLRPTMASAAAWAEGDMKKAGRWGQILGESTPEKRWLVASLCKHVSAQHGKFEGSRELARPSL